MKSIQLILAHFCVAITLFACSAPERQNEAESSVKNDSIANHEMHDQEMHNHDEMHKQEMAPSMEADDFKTSKYTEVHEFLGSTHFTIKYTAPVTKNRVIFGGLVAYNEVWVTGAHKATSIEFDKPVAFGGERIEAGTYAIFTIPGESEWTFILNLKYDQHLADDYTQEEDVLRLRISPIVLDEIEQRLTYELVESADIHYLRIAWDTRAIEVPLTLLN
jgi:hypothetical protein